MIPLFFSGPSRDEGWRWLPFPLLSLLAVLDSQESHQGQGRTRAKSGPKQKEAEPHEEKSEQGFLGNG